MKNAFKKSMIALNSIGKSGYDPRNDFDITATFFSDSENVYESVGEAGRVFDMSLDDYKNMLKEIHFYDLKKQNINIERM